MDEDKEHAVIIVEDCRVQVPVTVVPKVAQEI